MALRKYFVACLKDSEPYFETREVEFTYFNGFAVSQKQKSVNSMHENIRQMDDSLKVLEISTKSATALGVRLSAFNLTYYDEIDQREYQIENIFQSSKVFEYGGPYKDLLEVSPREAKKDERLKSSGHMKAFEFHHEVWPLEPKTMFYDWLYINALHRDRNLYRELLDSGYNAFTDIEFNHKKSTNCQARAAAIYVSLCRRGKLEESMKNRELFSSVYGISDRESLPV